jgi:acyl-CoA synthetase (AMP-forming)/AMP-acid ligase II
MQVLPAFDTIIARMVATHGEERARPTTSRSGWRRPYVFIDALPKNNYGKVLKTELRERLRARDV